VGDTSQRRAIRSYRDRLHARGMARFEVLGLDTDRDLIRSLARCLADDGPEVTELCAVISRAIGGGAPRRGSILAALRRSPLVGADLVLDRPVESGHKVDV
jgi:hypothetical protein